MNHSGKATSVKHWLLPGTEISSNYNHFFPPVLLGTIIVRDVAVDISPIVRAECIGTVVFYA